MAGILIKVFGKANFLEIEIKDKIPQAIGFHSEKISPFMPLNSRMRPEKIVKQLHFTFFLILKWDIIKICFITENVNL